MKKERIVSIRALSRRLLEKWRWILLAGIIAAAAAAGYKAVGLQKLLQTRAQEAAAAQEQAQEAAEQEQGISSYNGLDLLETTYKNRNAYLSESLLFRINPDAEGRASFLLEVEVPEDISETVAEPAEGTVPAETTLQEGAAEEEVLGLSIYVPKKGKEKDGQIVYVGSQNREEARLLKSYLSFITEGIDWTELAEEFQTRPQYLQELVSVEEYPGLSGARVTVICETAEGAEKIRNYVRRAVEAYSAQLQAEQGTHTVSVSQEKAGIVVDSDMESWIVNEVYNINTLYTYRTTLSRSAGTGGTSSGGGGGEVPVSTIVKILAKYAVFGFALGVFLFLAGYAFLLLMSGVVLSGKEFNTQYGTKRLAVFPGKGKKNPIDRMIAGIEGNYQTSPDRKECYSAAVANIRAQMGGQGTVAVISDLPEEITGNVVARLNAAAKGSAMYFVGADPGHSAEGINNVSASDAVVILVQCGRSRYGDTAVLLETLEGTGKKLLGSIVL